MLLFLYGKDTYRSKAQLRKMVEKFCADRDPQRLNVVRIDCDGVPEEEIMREVLAAPFLAQKRMVILEKLLASNKAVARRSILERISEQAIPESTVLVLWEETDSFRTNDAKAIVAALEKDPYTQKFDVLIGAARVAWIVQVVHDRGGSIDHTTASYIASVCGDDMWQLGNLLDQVIAYAEGRAITRADIPFFLQEKADDNIFSLVDAIVAKDKKHVFAMIAAQYHAGKDPGYIFAMLLRQFRILLELRDEFEQENTMRSEVLAKKLGIHPFVVKKSLPLVKRYTKESLIETYQSLLSLDTDVKLGRAGQGFLVDVFVGKQCSVQ